MKITQTETSEFEAKKVSWALQILRRLQSFVKEKNLFLNQLQSVIDQPNYKYATPTKIILRAELSKANAHPGTYVCQSNHVMGIVVDAHPKNKREVVLTWDTGEISFIDEKHSLYDPSAYAVLFPKGQPGFCRYMKSQNPRCKKDLSAREYYAFKFHERFDQNGSKIFNPVNSSSYFSNKNFF